jgi:phosphate/sulfate permease
MFREILKELKHHAPFTAFGAFTGIVIMVFFWKMPHKASYGTFYILHPLHVLLSAFVTTSMYKIHKCGYAKIKINIWILLAVGYAGSVGIATISDSIIPYMGEAMLNMPNREAHIGFIEEWRLVNISAVIGIALATLRPTTKFPHAAHVLVSTWASLFHILMAIGGRLSFFLGVAVFLFLFIAVWIPCCFSDIVFPLLFVKPGEASHSH